VSESLPKTLAEYVDPKASAVIVIDIQNDFVHSDGKSAKLGGDVAAAQQAVTQINRLIRAAREANVPVVYVKIQHSLTTDRPNYRARYRQRNMNPADLLCAAGSWGAELYSELVPPLPDDSVITKYSYDAFQDTPLDAILHSRSVTNVIVTGVVTNLCVQTTVEHAFGLGYYATIVTDGTAGDDKASHEAALRNLGQYFGVLADVESIVKCWQINQPSP